MLETSYSFLWKWRDPPADFEEANNRVIRIGASIEKCFSLIGQEESYEHQLALLAEVEKRIQYLACMVNICNGNASGRHGGPRIPYSDRLELFDYVQFFATSYNQKKNELIRQQRRRAGHHTSQDQQWVDNPAHVEDDSWKCEWELNEERYKAEEALNTTHMGLPMFGHYYKHVTD